MPALTRPDATVAYTDTGAPPDRPGAATVVFGHGLLFSCWMFHPQIAELRAEYRCVAVDWRGQGDSSAARTGYDMDTLAEDAAALIESLDVGAVHYVGLSMGGFVGQRLAARRPELIRSLSLLDTSAAPEEPAAARQDKVLANVYRLVGIGPVSSPVLKLMFGPTFRADPAGRPLIDEWRRRLGRSDRGAIRRAVLGVATRRPVLAELGAITAPTLVMVGADDAPTPVARAREIVDGVAGARLEIIPDCGHSSTVEQPAAVTALLSQFLAAH